MFLTIMIHLIYDGNALYILLCKKNASNYFISGEWVLRSATRLLAKSASKAGRIDTARWMVGKHDDSCIWGSRFTLKSSKLFLRLSLCRKMIYKSSHQKPLLFTISLCPILQCRKASFHYARCPVIWSPLELNYGNNYI